MRPLLSLAAALVVAGCGLEANPPPAVRCAAASDFDGLVLAGSGTNLPLVRRIVARWSEAQPQRRVHVAESIGTSGAVAAVVDGVVDLGLASRPLTEAELALGLVEHPHVRVPVGFFVSAATGERTVSVDELALILSARSAQWADGSPVVGVLRERGDSGNRLLRGLAPSLGAALDEALDLQRWPVANTDQALVDALVGSDRAIGLLDLGSVRLDRLSLPAVRLTGLPGATGALSPEHRRWPWTKPLSFFTLGAPKGAAAELLAYARSGMVSDLIGAGGYRPAEQP